MSYSCSWLEAGLPRRCAGSRAARRHGPPTSSCGGRRGSTPRKTQAVREIIAAFEQTSGKQVALIFSPPKTSFRGRSRRRSRSASRPTLPSAFCLQYYIGQWAFEDRLVDLSDAVGHFSRPVRSGGAQQANCCSTRRPGKRPCMRCRLVARPTTSTSGRVCWSRQASRLADIPREWEAFWSFWCDQVQPAVRRATGATTSGASDCRCRPTQRTPHIGVRPVHRSAYEAAYATPDGRLVIDDPEVRRKLIKAMDSYTAIYRKGCTPPDSRELGQYRQQQGVPGPDTSS